MSESLASGYQRNYGSTSTVPNVEIVGQQFNSEAVKHLSESVATNIYTINNGWKNLEQAYKSIGTDRDSQGLRDKVHVTQLSCNQIVAQTTKDLHKLTSLVRKGDKQSKLRVEKLTSDFKEALQCYSKFQKQVAEKMKIHLLTRQTSTTSYNEDTEQAFFEQQEKLAAQKNLQKNLEFETEMLLEREQTMRKIEEDVLDINEIMRELGAMVHEQGETIDTIEGNIENVHGNVEGGRTELQKAEGYQAKYRRKICVLVFIALVISIILAVVIAVEVKSK
ncbi:syntaxin-7 [Schistocerca serialis cubense]|uniref:syntaxin-7 n=1 Tax=Schistocerca serialis cubense TaxID=2023355 RepID=UPI00214E3553|nr:syntaxin-7 [Schistocerca serialis cubense]